MDRRLARRAVPARYALVTLVAVLSVHAVLFPVIIAGAVLPGLVYTPLAGGAGSRLPACDRPRSQ